MQFPSSMKASCNRNAHRIMFAMGILVYALPAILVFPWCCQSFLTNFPTSGFPTSLASSTSTSTPTLLGAINSTTSVRKRTESFSEKSELRISQKRENNGEIESEERRKLENGIYLFSLNWIQENDPEYYRKKDVRRLWEWKDTTLGDGRDFFVPKPKTLMALQKYFLTNIPCLTECSIISNCARLEILCSCSYPKKTEDRNQTPHKLAHDISNCFLVQLNYNQDLSKKANPWTKIMLQLPMNTDRPESILTTAAPVKDPLRSEAYFESWWNITTGTEAILVRLCKVSAGMAHRPRRPDRPVIFRPFSSRDAHVLLQLKRTRENIAFSPDVSETDEGGTSATRQQKQRQRRVLPVILDCALRAGKATRNPDIVPEIEELRKLTAAESSTCSPSDLKISQRVADAAYEKGILPLVNDCAMKLDQSTQFIDRRIAEFRQSAMDFLVEIVNQGTNSTRSVGKEESIDKETLHRELRSWLNRRLHKPTIQLRSRSQQSIEDTVDTVESVLTEHLAQIRVELEHEYYRIMKTIR